MKLRKLQQYGFKYLLKTQDIYCSFKNDELEFLKGEKKEIKEAFQKIQLEMNELNPNINIIQAYKVKMHEFQSK